MSSANVRESLAFQVSMYQLSDMERDALNHYSGIPSPDMIEALRGGIMVMQNILSELWHKGVRLRIVPKGTNLTDLPECLDLKKYKMPDGKNYLDIKTVGLYRDQYKLIIVKEEHLLDKGSVNQKFWVLVHEFAHAIWDLLLTSQERAYVTHLHRLERTQCPASAEYRLTNEFEMFADGFRYYVTPHRESFILKVTNQPKGKRAVVEDQKSMDPSKEDLKELNLKLYEFLDGKFRGIIDPELVMARSLGCDEEESFEYYEECRLYGPVINLGTISSFTDINVVEVEAS